MSDNGTQCTIKDLLPTQFERMQDAVAEQVDSDPELSQKRWPGFVRKIIADKATKAVLTALDKSVFLILPAAWSRAPELAEYSDQTKHPPDSETTLFLGEHKFEMDYKPVMNVTILGIARPFLKLRLILSAQVRAASITVRNGHIVSLGECDCAVEAELKHLIEGSDQVTESPIHLKLKSRDLKLAEAFELRPPGVRIAPARMH